MKLIMHNIKSHLASCPTDLVWQVVLILTIVGCASKQAQGLKATIYRKEKSLGALSLWLFLVTSRLSKP